MFASPFFGIVGFDLDGTLMDTSGDLAVAVNHALREGEREPLPVERIVAMIGGGARHMLQQALAAAGGAKDAEVDRLRLFGSACRDAGSGCGDRQLWSAY